MHSRDEKAKHQNGPSTHSGLLLIIQCSEFLPLRKIIRMPLFCLPMKAKKSSSSKVPDSITSNHIQQQNISDSINDAKSNLVNRTPLRYVTNEFYAKVKDELTVMQDELVLFEYEDSSGDWSHVRSISTSKSGYVPSKILSERRLLPSARRKKMPRDERRRVESCRHSHHEGHNHHVSGPAVSSNGDQSRFSDHQLSCAGHHQHHLLNVPHSFQGSNSNQTLSKFNDMTMVDHSPATYYNLRAPLNHCGESFDSDFSMKQLFIREDFGRFVVMTNFVAREEKDLEVRAGDIVRVLNKDDEDWYWVRRECDNEEGFVPAKFIKDLLSYESILNKGNSTISMKSSNLNAVPTYSNQMETLQAEQQLMPSSITLT